MRRTSLYTKVLSAFLFLSLIPILLLALASFESFRSAELFLKGKTVRLLDDQAEERLVFRAEMVAKEVANLLRSIESDLRDLALIPVEEEAFLRFSRNHQREVWYRAGSNDAPVDVRESIPLYAELAFVGADGRERIRIEEGSLVDVLRDLSETGSTTYLKERYFEEARNLPPGEIYVSHVTGWHVGRDEQLQGASSPEEAIEGRKYRGVLRFAMPVHSPEGGLEGVVVLSLDHRHLMEFTQHILPVEQRLTLFPSYDSGNYAFMFDDEGWIITHPKYWDIRGLDPEGDLVSPYTADSSPEDVAKGRIPFNLLEAAFVHENYPRVAREVLAGRSGLVDATNVGGARKVMAFAPVFYDGGSYRRMGVFGGVTIGAELESFRSPALTASEEVAREFQHFLWQTAALLLVTAILVAFAAWKLAGHITEPLKRLIEGTRRMARGRMSARVVVRSRDEVGLLAESFNAMADDLQRRRERLLKTLQDLRRSRREILRERNATGTIVENIETGILSLDGGGKILSANTPARKLLGWDEAPSSSIEVAFEGWPEIARALEEPLYERAPRKKWSRYVETVRGGGEMTLRLALLPLKGEGTEGWILTVEDLTERVRLRERFERMERLASLGRLSAGIAHEVRNPLTGISLLLDDLHDRLVGDGKERELIRKALDEIDRLENLVSELLDFAVVNRGELRPCSLSEILAESLFLVRAQCLKLDISVAEEIDRKIPLLPLDQGKIKQVFLNLLTNAVDAMPDGGTLAVGTGFAEGEVTAYVRDTGEGIPEDRQALVFEPFFTTKGGGGGLGLAISHNIVLEHGGRIELLSAPGKGTTFTLRFPVDYTPPGRAD